MWSPAGIDSVPADQVDDFTGRLVELSGPHAERVGELMTVIDDSHPHDRVLPAVRRRRAELQGRGTGSAVMAPMLAECDRDGIAAYLVSTSPRSRSSTSVTGSGSSTSSACLTAPYVGDVARASERLIRALVLRSGRCAVAHRPHHPATMTETTTAPLLSRRLPRTDAARVFTLILVAAVANLDLAVATSLCPTSARRSIRRRPSSTSWLSGSRSASPVRCCGSALSVIATAGR